MFLHPVIPSKSYSDQKIRRPYPMLDKAESTPLPYLSYQSYSPA